MKINTPIKLTHEFKSALDELENGNSHLFVTGKAGSGKSTLLNLFRKNTSKKLVVLAPTGVAALQVGGQTIHSFFGIPPRLINSGELMIRKYRSKLFKALDIIIIDEISMVRADLMDHMDFLLRSYRRNDKPFGGVRLILFGDLYQIPPVVASPEEKKYFSEVYESPYFFSSKIFGQIRSFNIIELTEVFRQDEKAFLRILDEIRNGEIDEENLQVLNQRCNPDFEQVNPYITLTSTNAIADSLNIKELNKIDNEARVFNGSTTGKFSAHILPADQHLILKKGAQIMLTRNDSEQNYANGTIGVVSGFNDEGIELLIKKDHVEEKVLVKKAVWEQVEYKFKPDKEGEIEMETVGTYTQYPLKLAWAITIHKSQGKTLENVIVDLGRGAFEYGQTYVALSRCTKLNGLILKKQIRPSDIQVDERIIDFIRRYR
jgi:ATP-dependent DNA helicase PIF1